MKPSWEGILIVEDNAVKYAAPDWRSDAAFDKAKHQLEELF